MWVTCNHRTCLMGMMMVAQGLRWPPSPMLHLTQNKVQLLIPPVVATHSLRFIHIAKNRWMSPNPDWESDGEMAKVVLLFIAFIHIVVPIQQSPYSVTCLTWIRLAAESGSSVSADAACHPDPCRLKVWFDWTFKINAHLPRYWDHASKSFEMR